MPISNTPKRVAGRHPRQRQRHAPMIVERFLRRVRRARIAQAGAQHLLGAGLAGAARDGDDARVRREPRARRAPMRFERVQRIVDAEQRAVSGCCRA